MTSQPGQKTVTIHILLNISRSKDNQTMKLSQLIVYNMRIFLIKNHAQNVAEKLFQHCYLKNQK